MGKYKTFRWFKSGSKVPIDAVVLKIEERTEGYSIVPYILYEYPLKDDNEENGKEE